MVIIEVCQRFPSTTRKGERAYCMGRELEGSRNGDANLMQQVLCCAVITVLVMDS